MVGRDQDVPSPSYIGVYVHLGEYFYGFTKKLNQTTLTQIVNEGFFFTMLLTLVACKHYDMCHSHWCEKISYFCFDFHFLTHKFWWSLLHMPFGHPYSFFVKWSINFFIQFLNGFFLSLSFVILKCYLFLTFCVETTYCLYSSIY